MLRKILIGLVIIFIVIQFIRPKRNEGATNGPPALTNLQSVPPDVAATLDRSCYDCHSNHTRYPWYSNVQPVAWWLQHHIDEGRAELNFSEWGNYPKKRQVRKLEEIREQVEKGEMPLSSYTAIHKDARLSPEEKAGLINWTRAMETSLRGSN